MVKDPLAEIRNLYSHFGWPLTPEIEAGMKKHMEENRQHKHGAHKYSLEEFSITEEELRENLSDYLEYFGKEEKLL
jgi:hypothetical protein